MKNSFERFNRSIAVGLIGLAGATALGGCSSSTKTASSKGSLCTGVEFLSGKGVPGDIEMFVYPVLKDEKAPNVVTGKVVSGSGKGATIYNSVTFANAGTFDFKYNDTILASQTSTVEISAQVTGESQLQECPVTTLHFDPTTQVVSPIHTGNL